VQELLFIKSKNWNEEISSYAQKIRRLTDFPSPSESTWNIKQIFLKFLVFTNFNKVFPVVVLVFDEFSDGMLNPY
jgi:hypothetical protein